MLKIGLLMVLTISIPSAVGIWMISHELVPLLGGLDYLESVNVLKVLSLAIPFCALSSFYRSVILVPNREEKFCLKISVSCAVVNLMLNFVIVPIIGIIGAALTTLLAEIIAFCVALKGAEKYHELLIDRKAFSSILIPSLSVALLCVLLKHYTNGIRYLAFSICGSIALFFLLSVAFKNPLVRNWTNKDKLG